MSYDISFRVKVEGTNMWIPIGDCRANITYNVGELIRESTGLPWVNEANNGFAKHVIIRIERGLDELQNHPEKYKPLESSNGWGTIEGTIRFFEEIIGCWKDLVCDYEPLADIATFWIM